jgi:hypothetical protein
LKLSLPRQRLEQTVEFDVTQGRWRGRESFKAWLG